MPIELRFEPTFWDVVRVLRAIYRVQPVPRALRWIGWVAVAAGVMGVFLPIVPASAGVTFIAWGALVLLLLALLPVPFAWMTRSGSPLWKGEQVYQLDDEGIRASHVSAESFLAWSALRKVRETDRLFLLFTSNQAACFIPKSALAGDQVEAVRRLLAAHIGRARILVTPAPAAGTSPGEEAAITGRFTWTTRELYRANLAMALHGSRIWIGSVLFMAALVALNGAPYVYHRLRAGGSLSLGLALLYAFPLLFVLALAPLSAWWAARQQLRTRRASQGEQVVAIGEAGVHASGGVHNGTLAWDAFTRVVETRDQFLFCVGKVQGLAIPARAFAPEQRQALRALAQEKLGRRFMRTGGR